MWDVSVFRIYECVQFIVEFILGAVHFVGAIINRP